MYRFLARDIEVGISDDAKCISSLKIKNKERCVGESPIFALRVRDKNGEVVYINSTLSALTEMNEGEITYKGFQNPFSRLTVVVKIDTDEDISWKISIFGVPEEYAVEWVELPKITLPRLIDNDERGGKLLFPYDEGIILTDETLLPRYEMEFPMSGAYFIFPNMVCSQFMAYLFEDAGLYIGAHDKKRGFKGVDFYPVDNGLSLQIRLYSGVGFGDDFKQDFPIVWKACGENWKDSAEIYRSWFESELPKNVVPIKENKALPKWYETSPLIVTYPVRGTHDMDKMEPNALFPYTNALPILDRIKSDTGCQIMALLMHWEGTAPWAPPYVWPPYGGEELFYEFRDKLHKNGDLLGVYCSGFGYTLRSTLIEEYNCEERIKRENALQGVCHSPQNKPELGITCTPYQRYGYDICPASKRGREILDEAYEPLFKCGADYVQILDQNHGGGQYMCYAREHGHPPMPGEWMTSNMQGLLSDWSAKAENMLFGCESAGAEPFIGSLLMSDNRFELNYPYGMPVPLYAYIYHEYVRNFMGNQCGCPFDTKIDTLRYRLAYSFSIGDIMTLVLSPDGNLMTHWSTRDFEHSPNMEKTLRFIKNMMKLYNNGAKEYLCFGRMSNSTDIECEKISFPMLRGRETAVLPRLLSSCWEAENGRSMYIVVNPEDEVVTFSIGEDTYQINALEGMMILK
ncbi:MAG: hypothetical protein J6B29_04220 [Clostridia bacterium]|nr:hypothetical protein [Clostridia bacterium]